MILTLEIQGFYYGKAHKKKDNNTSKILMMNLFTKKELKHHTKNHPINKDN